MWLITTSSSILSPCYGFHCFSFEHTKRQTLSFSLELSYGCGLNKIRSVGGVLCVHCFMMLSICKFGICVFLWSYLICCRLILYFWVTGFLLWVFHSVEWLCLYYLYWKYVRSFYPQWQLDLRPPFSLFLPLNSVFVHRIFPLPASHLLSSFHNYHPQSSFFHRGSLFRTLTLTRILTLSRDPSFFLRVRPIMTL